MSGLKQIQDLIAGFEAGKPASQERLQECRLQLGCGHGHGEENHGPRVGKAFEQLGGHRIWME